MKHLKLYESWKPNFDRKTIWDAIEWEDNYKDLYPGYSDETSEFTDEYYFDTKEQAEDYADNVIGILEGLPDPIQVFRAIKADTVKDIDLEDPGESWSFERKSAIDFGSRNMSNFLLSATVEKDDVNWAGTIKAYAIFSGSYTDEDENEIVIDDVDKIKNIRIEKI